MLGVETSSSPASLTEAKTLATTNPVPVTPAQTKSPITEPLTQPQPVAPQRPDGSGSQTSSTARRETQSAVPEAEKPEASTQERSIPLGPQQTPETIPHWTEPTVLTASQFSSMSAPPEPSDTGRPSLPLAAQETHLLAPEPPKTSTSSEILLHLTGNDQSSAAIRVADRAGSVDVSVHASDPPPPPPRPPPPPPPRPSFGVPPPFALSLSLSLSLSPSFSSSFPPC